MFVAIHADGRPAAILGVHHSRSPTCSAPEEVRLAEYIATLTGAALENAATTARLEHQAFHDPLTGLANRALVLDRLAQAPAARRAARRGPLRDAARPRRLQERQRQPRPRRRRPPARRSPRSACAGCCGPPTRRPASAATSSRCCWRTRRRRRGGGRGRPHPRGVRRARSTSAAARCSSRRPSASPRPRRGSATPRRSCATPTPPCTRPRRRASAGYAVFVPADAHGGVARLEMETRLRHAVERGEMELAYQPIVAHGRRGHRRRRGARALAPPRGRASSAPAVHPAGRGDRASSTRSASGCCAPPAATSGSCAARARRGRRSPVTVNLSPRQLRNPGLADRVAAVLAETGLPAGAAHPGDHRDGDGGRHAGQPRLAAGPAPARRARGGRRLRLGLLVARPAAAPARGHAEGRPGVPGRGALDRRRMPCCGPSSSWATAWASAWWPRASSGRTSSSWCGPSGARWDRAGSGRGRCRPTVRALLGA